MSQHVSITRRMTLNTQTNPAWRELNSDQLKTTGVVSYAECR